MKAKILNRAVFFKGGSLPKGTKVFVAQKNKHTSLVRIENDDRNEYLVGNDALDNVPKLAKGYLHFKDEGSYYSYKLTKDGKVTDPTELYEFGSLVEHMAVNKKVARDIAKMFNCEPLFG